MDEQEIVMGDDIGGRFSVGEEDGYGAAFWKTGKMVCLRQFVINETTLSSTV